MTKEEARKILSLRFGYDDRELERARKVSMKAAHPDIGGPPGGVDMVLAAYHTLMDVNSIDWAMFEVKPNELEGPFQTKVMKSLGCFVFNCHGGIFQEAGMPDLYVAHPQFTGWLELKVNARLEKHQQVKIDELLICGVVATVLRKRRFEHRGEAFYELSGLPMIGDLANMAARLNELVGGLRW